jgi:hypothetical protein
VIKALCISVYFYNTLFINVSGEVDVTDASLLSLRGAQATCLHTEVLFYGTQAWQTVNSTAIKL